MTAVDRGTKTHPKRKVIIFCFTFEFWLLKIDLTFHEICNNFLFEREYLIFFKINLCEQNTKYESYNVNVFNV